MRVAVIGGTGGLGATVAARLVDRGHPVRIVSRTRPERVEPGIEHRGADLATGAGLAEALDGMDVVVDAVNSQKQTRAVLVDGVNRLLTAEQEAGIGHHVAISLVGCDLVPMAYNTAKVEQERLVTAGPVPWTLLRATQFHGYLATMLSAAARARITPRSGALFQPVDIAAVADELVHAVESGPAGRLADIGGPEARTLTELANQWRQAHHGTLVPLRIPLPGKAGRALRAGAGCLDDTGRPVGGGFAEWLAAESDRVAR
ncbi:SDR family oxidoreductase [Nocardia sp. NPDC088792]|uniref:SDR family oxidoreductase n=1 Tax=Nocardia sp. NPDC088792 TaxID=3364332 RepID=UPI0038286565